MSLVRVFVGTRKGAFVLSSDASRKEWQVNGPIFPGLEIFHIKASPLNPNRIYASQAGDWFGQVMHRSDDGGETWQVVSNKFLYEGDPGTHQFYDGTLVPWKFKRIWVLEPSLFEADTVYAGAEDAALFKSIDGGQTWQELAGLRDVKGHLWSPGAGGLCLHTIIQNPKDPNQLFVAISAAGAFRTDDGGKTWKAINKGLHSDYELPDSDADVGHCVHGLAMHPQNPGVLFMQKHWDVLRSDNSGELWHEVSGNLPTDFGFPIVVHAHEPETVYVIPIKSDSEHFPPEGKLRVYRSKSGGNTWEALTKGLPQKDCFVNVYRSAMTVDTFDPCGVYFGTTGGQVYASANAGDSWEPIVRDLPAVLSVEVQTIA
ncbi:MAG: WD40/YVTN/BNR-like repeat-containing protein [Anaerolineaceae bacterium]|jgi:photosystem II stability/assembly factor-like uncharacterized protein